MQEKIESQYREKVQNVYSIYETYSSEFHGRTENHVADEEEGDFGTYF